MTVGGKTIHRACVKCVVCGVEPADGKVYQREGWIVCAPHATDASPDCVAHFGSKSAAAAAAVKSQEDDVQALTAKFTDIRRRVEERRALLSVAE